MSFPANPSIGDTHTTTGNLVYQYTEKKVWKLKRSANGSSGGSSFNYTASLNAPSSPSLGDQWFDENVSVLKSWGYDGQSYSWISISGDDASTNNYTSASDVVLPLMWLYGTNPFSFELWSDDVNYTWVNINPTAVTSGLAGDDSLYVGSTVGFKAGGSYVLYKNDGTYIKRITVLSILNNTVIRLVSDLDVNITETDGFSLGRTSAARHTGGAIFKNGDIYIGKEITPITSSGQLILRRSSTGTGIFSVFYRLSGSTTFVPMDLTQTMAVGTDFRDEYYSVPAGGKLQFMVTYAGTATETVYYMVGLPISQTVDANRVQQPVNVYPTDQTVNVSTTPTLLGSPFTSIYGLAENGAEFRVASDKAFKNIVVSSSTDFLSSFTRITGQTASFTSVVFYSGRKGVAVGLGGTVSTTTDGGNTYTPGTPATSVDFADVAYNGSNTLLAVGATGSLQYSTNFGATWTNGNASDAFAGQLNGVAGFGIYGVAVGANGEILRTTTSGQIWNRVSPDNSYTGTFYGVACDQKGNYVAVGSNGEIQFSPDNGFTWSHRPNAGNYTGNFRDVAMDNNGNVIVVGDNAAIQMSANYANNWSAKAADNGFTGTFNDVSLVNGYACVVGVNGEIQSSKNGGLNWTHRSSGSGETKTFNAVALTNDNYGLILGASGAVQKAVKLEGATTSYTVPAGSDLLGINKLYYWQCRYQDAAGFWSSWSVPTIFATSATLNYVAQPSNLSPASGATAIPTKPTLQSSKFAFTGATDTQVAANWQIATDQAFSNIVYDSGDVSDFTSHIVPAANPTTPLPSAGLTSGSTYYWRVRHKGTNDGYSSFSASTPFAVSSQANQPVISTPANNASVYGDGLVCTIASFSSAVANDSLQDTQFQFDTTLTFSAPITIDAGQSLTTTLSNNTLKQSTTYYLRARTKGTLSDYSQWSNVSVINTRVNAPIGESVFLNTNTDGSAFTTKFYVPDNVYQVSYVAVAAGGAGGISNRTYSNADQNLVSGGGGGGLVYGTVNVTPQNPITVTVGACLQPNWGVGSGSSGGTYTNNSLYGLKYGPNGSSSSFGSYGTAYGGTGGFFSSGADSTTNGSGGANLATRTAKPGSSYYTYQVSGGPGGSFVGGDGGGTGGAGGDLFVDQQLNYMPCFPGGGGAAGYGGPGGKGASVNCNRTQSQDFDVSMIIPATAGTNGGGAGGYTSIPRFNNGSGTGSKRVYNDVSNGSNIWESCYGGGTGIFGKGASGQPVTFNDGGPGSIDQGDLRNFGGGGSCQQFAYDSNEPNNQPDIYRYYSSPRKAIITGAVRVIWGTNRNFPFNAK